MAPSLRLVVEATSFATRDLRFLPPGLDQQGQLGVGLIRLPGVGTADVLYDAMANARDVIRVVEYVSRPVFRIQPQAVAHENREYGV